MCLLTANNVKARHELLEGAIGVFPEEEIAYKKVKTLTWILPLFVLIGAVLDMILVFIYMRFAHPWKLILYGEMSEREVEDKDNGLQNQCLPKNEVIPNQEDEITHL